MSRVPLFALASLSLLGCHRTPGTDWPEAERKALIEQCHTSAGEDASWQCDCLYAPAGLPAKVAWHEFEAWQDAKKLGTPDDPTVTHVVAQVSAKCAIDHLAGGAK